MSSGNRVEELEARVRELEATVNGLTDELVESRERLHAIEEEVDIDQNIIEGKPTRNDVAEDVSDDDPIPQDDQQQDDAGSGSGDDIIVA